MKSKFTIPTIRSAVHSSSILFVLAWTTVALPVAEAAGGCPCNGDIVPPFGGGNQPDISDVSAVVNCWRGSSNNPACDINCDGIVSTRDIGIVICSFRTLNNPQCCDPPFGGCCQNSAPSCMEVPAFGGTDNCAPYQGDGTTCTPNLCDCNSNGVGDSCDVSCGPPGSICDVPGCGLSADCNQNGSPDECENPAPTTRGACCFTTAAGVASCANNVTLANCDSLGGTWYVCQRCASQNAGVFAEGGGVFAHVIGPPVACIVLPFMEERIARGICTPGEPLTDPWVSPADGAMCLTFGAAAETPALPPGFFGPGSDPFTGTVCVMGVSLADPDFPLADTLISRSADPFDVCAAPSPEMSTVDIEIVALSLVSTSPITVTYDGGASSDMWDVAVDLSTVAAPMGTLTATKTYCNGGTYTSTLPVQPRFTFTPVGGGTPAVLDTGLEGMPPVILDQDDPLPWVSDVQPMFPLVSDPCTNFHPGIDDVFEGLPCDCNANGVMDSCDIESATARDCNVNARPDSCDIADGTSLDVDGNGFPDECPIVPPAIPLGDPSGLNKTRFISFSVAAGDGETALRIVLDTLHEVVPPYTGGPTIPFDAFEGEVRWVGAPVSYMESSASGIPFFASQLQCDPYYQDWSTVGLLHVTGSAITPSSIYEVEHLGASCEGAEAGCAAVAAPLAISTTRWGDVRTPYNPPDPSVQPDISDVSSLVDKFRNAPGAPIKARGFLAGAPGNPFGEITPAVLGVDFGFSHISACVDAFRGVPYPYTISACP